MSPSISLVIPLGLLGLVFTAGVISNLVTIIFYRKNLVAYGGYDSAIESHYHAFNDLGSLPDSFVGSRLDVSFAVPFYMQVCVTFSAGPNQGDTFRSGLLTFFGAHIELWGEY